MSEAALKIQSLRKVRWQKILFKHCFLASEECADAPFRQARPSTGQLHSQWALSLRFSLRPSLVGAAHSLVLLLITLSSMVASAHIANCSGALHSRVADRVKIRKFETLRLNPWNAEWSGHGSVAKKPSDETVGISFDQESGHEALSMKLANLQVHSKMNTIELTIQVDDPKVLDSGDLSIIVRGAHQDRSESEITFAAKIGRSSIVHESNGAYRLALNWTEFQLLEVAGLESYSSEARSLPNLLLSSFGLSLSNTREYQNAEIEIQGPISFSADLESALMSRSSLMETPEGVQRVLNFEDPLSTPYSYLGFSSSSFVMDLAQAFKKISVAQAGGDPEASYSVTFKVPVRHRADSERTMTHEELMNFIETDPSRILFSRSLLDALLAHPLASELNHPALGEVNPIEELLEYDEISRELVKRLYDKGTQNIYLQKLKDEGIDGIVRAAEELGFQVNVQPANQGLGDVWQIGMLGIVNPSSHRGPKQKMILYDPASLEHGPLSHILQALTLYHGASDDEIAYLDQLFWGLRSNQSYFREVWHFLFDGPGSAFPNSPDYWQNRAVEDFGVTITQEEYLAYGERLER